MIKTTNARTSYLPSTSTTSKSPKSWIYNFHVQYQAVILPSFHHRKRWDCPTKRGVLSTGSKVRRLMKREDFSPFFPFLLLLLLLHELKELLLAELAVRACCLCVFTAVKFCQNKSSDNLFLSHSWSLQLDDKDELCQFSGWKTKDDSLVTDRHINTNWIHSAVFPPKPSVHERDSGKFFQYFFSSLFFRFSSLRSFIPCICSWECSTRKAN